jgi:Flp pilus assembly protein TadG
MRAQFFGPGAAAFRAGGVSVIRVRKNSAVRLARELAEERRGAAAVEFAVLAPLFVALLGGLVDTSRLITRTMQVRAAAQAGADYAQIHGFDAAGMQAAARSAAGGAVTIRTPLRQDLCVAAGRLGTCAQGATAASFATVTAEMAYRPLLPGLSAALPRTLTARARVRLS